MVVRWLEGLNLFLTYFLYMTASSFFGLLKMRVRLLNSVCRLMKRLRDSVLIS